MGWGSEYDAVLTVGQVQLGVVLTERRLGKVLSQQHTCLTVERQAEGGTCLENTANTAVRWIQETVGRTYLRTRILLADPYLQHQVLAMERFPRRRKQQHALLAWRLQQDRQKSWQEESQMPLLAWRVLPQTHREGQSVYLTTLPATVRQALVAPFEKWGRPVDVMMPMIQACQPAPAKPKTDSLVVYLFGEHWTTVRYRDGELDTVRCRWLGTGAGEDAIKRDLARGVTEEGFRYISLYPAEDKTLLADRLVDLLDSLGAVDVTRGPLPLAMPFDAQRDGGLSEPPPGDTANRSGVA